MSRKLWTSKILIVSIMNYSPVNKKIVLLSVIALLILIPFLLRPVIWKMAASENAQFSGRDKELSTVQLQINREIAELDKKLGSKQPKSYFLVINTSLNEFVALLKKYS